MILTGHSLHSRRNSPCIMDYAATEDTKSSRNCSKTRANSSLPFLSLNPPFRFFGAIEIALACHDRAREHLAVLIGAADLFCAQEAFAKTYDILEAHGKEGTDIHA